MIWQYTPHTILLIGASVISVIMGIYAGFYRRVPGSRAGILLILATSEWMAAYALELAAADLASKILWNKVQYFGVVTVPAAWFIFTLFYTGREIWLTRKRIALLLIIPLITLVLVWTNEYHGLVWSGFILNTEGSFSTLINVHGPWFWVNTAYSYVLVFSGALLLLVQILTCRSSLYRWQISALLLGALFSWGANGLFLFGLNPFPAFDLTPFGFLVTNTAVIITIGYFQLGDFVPIARRTVVESMGDSVIVLDEENRIMDMNPSARQVMGTPSEFIGIPVGQVWPAWSNQIESGSGFKSKELILTGENGQRIYDVEISPLTDWRGRTVSRVVVLRDITEHKRAEEKIKQSLQEKELLLREIHHRVKNNIQIISSLLSLQSHYIKDKAYSEMLRDSQSRIKSMALIHEKLYQSKSLANIDFKEYITTLVHSLFQSYGVSMGSILLEVEVEKISLDIDAAIPCGLIINELVSNSLKHAFPEGQGKIRICFRSVDDSKELIVSDNGIGIPESVDLDTTQSLGLHLVKILAEDQLDGKISLERSEGTTFCITF